MTEIKHDKNEYLVIGVICVFVALIVFSIINQLFGIISPPTSSKPTAPSAAAIKLSEKASEVANDINYKYDILYDEIFSYQEKLLSYCYSITKDYPESGSAPSLEMDCIDNAYTPRGEFITSREHIDSKLYTDSLINDRVGEIVKGGNDRYNSLINVGLLMKKRMEKTCIFTYEDIGYIAGRKCDFASDTYDFSGYRLNPFSVSDYIE